MFPEADRMDLCFQVANGLLYLHASGVVFGDLKAQNVLIDHGGTAKLTDFGLSVLRDSSILFSSTGNPGSGTARWMAPELFEESSMRSSEGDMYALAMEILTDRFPFPHLNNDTQVILAVVYRNAMPNRPERLEANSEQNEEFWSLLLQCWNRQPNMRPNAATIAQKSNSKLYVMIELAQPSARCARGFAAVQIVFTNLTLLLLTCVAKSIFAFIRVKPWIMFDNSVVDQIQTEPSATKKWFSGGTAAQLCKAYTVGRAGSYGTSYT
ncbi:hypothetical protein FRC09_004546 [Ceratobasidium sp. 395]|nr:hypothetical protein FRC09_004546 [Ceratobasidium sp. 395]